LICLHFYTSTDTDTDTEGHVNIFSSAKSVM